MLHFMLLLFSSITIILLLLLLLLLFLKLNSIRVCVNCTFVLLFVVYEFAGNEYVLV